MKQQPKEFCALSCEPIVACLPVRNGSLRSGSKLLKHAGCLTSSPDKAAIGIKSVLLWQTA
eukprot:1171935-Amphidinium_carterae.2